MSSPEGRVTHIRFTVRGVVQGVGFRAFVAHRARLLGVQGMVRNLADGGVEVEAEGERTALEHLLENARSGPRGARVIGVDEIWSEGPRRHRDFRIEGSTR
jgi:acylphosphatase